MVKIGLHIIFLVVLPSVCLSQYTQPGNANSSQLVNNLKMKLAGAKDDSTRLMVMQDIGFFYERLDVDSCLKYYNAALKLARQSSYSWGEARVLASMSGLMEHQGRYAEAFELLFKSLKMAEDHKSAYDIARGNRRISGIYFQLENYPKAVAYLIKAVQIDEANHLPDKVAIDYYALGDAYEKMNELDSAAYYINMALQQKHLLKGLLHSVYQIDGHIRQKRGNYAKAFLSYYQAFKQAQLRSDLVGSSEICADISALYIQQHARDSALFYALKGFNYGKEVSFKKGVMLNANLIAGLYDSTQPSLALQYYKIAAAAKESLFGVSTIQTIQDLLLGEEARQKQLEEAEAAYKEKLRLYGLLSGLAALLVIAFILYRNNTQKQKANLLLQQQKEKIEITLNELKSTQAQLIHSEKMASLGEMTAGIAHEIQNPLNFVNNFSDLNQELIAELKAELKAGNLDEVEAIATDLETNEGKINHHGKRADSIVKGMLEHSRTSTGQKELTDINKLTDEYLRLAYTSMVAKANLFHAVPVTIGIKTDFDNTITNIHIIPQDIGRVLLNLYNNAFYAVAEKTKQEIPGYQPTVIVSTKKVDHRIIISVKDNGNGIPGKIKDKIFQPFFTTKPTGEGTGLGLSLSYDIVKAHGGEIKVETKEGEGTEFIIQLSHT